MIIDGRQIAPGSNVKADLAIVGAGPAGIAIAREFVNHPARIVLLESGSTALREENQLLCRGNTSGNFYPPLHLCRRRVLGGSTSYWGGWSRPLDDIDFEERPWVPYSGWPFTREQLNAEYARAHAIWKLGKYDYDFRPAGAESSETFLKATQNSFEDILFKVNATRFGKAYREELEKAPNLSLILHSNVLEIEMDRDQKAALSVKVATLAGNRFSVSARNFVLAAGGLENPRILLASRGSRESGVGNENDLVGRFFADHLHVMLPRIPLNGRQLPSFFPSRPTDEGAVRGGMALTEDTRRREKLLGLAITIHNPDNPHDVVHPTYSNLGYSSLQALIRPLANGEVPDLLGYHFRLVLQDPVNAFALSFQRLVKMPWRAFAIGVRAEQVPNPNSRVLLDGERDVLGMNKVRLDWQLTEQDLDSLRRAQRILESELNFPCSGAEQVQRADEHALEITGASHHMGTTRMHRDPKLGVVDESCRVHGIRNLYVTGSSVFPTSGWVPPTLTIIALALRLADYLKRSF
jgi:choline dehydrogenase-like flavoprotein